MLLVMLISMFCHLAAIIVGGVVFEIQDGDQTVLHAIKTTFDAVHIATESTFFICPIISIWSASRMPDYGLAIMVAVMIELAMCAVQFYSIMIAAL